MQLETHYEQLQFSSICEGGEFEGSEQVSHVRVSSEKMIPVIEDSQQKLKCGKL